MIEYLLDTHALVWLLVADPRLPRSVRTLVEDATAALFLRVPLISRDRKIVVDGIPTLWG
jgi:PIN domain nuclease of toxin-antitoxin system